MDQPSSHNRPPRWGEKWEDYRGGDAGKGCWQEPRRARKRQSIRKVNWTRARTISKVQKTFLAPSKRPKFQSWMGHSSFFALWLFDWGCRCLNYFTYFYISLRREVEVKSLKSLVEVAPFYTFKYFFLILQIVWFWILVTSSRKVLCDAGLHSDRCSSLSDKARVFAGLTLAVR